MGYSCARAAVAPCWHAAGKTTAILSGIQRVMDFERAIFEDEPRWESTDWWWARQNSNL
jgi:hypothetical protein